MRRLLPALALLLLAPFARADPPAFSLQLFRPTIDGKGFVTVDGSELLGHLDVSLGLVASYAHDVLTLTGQGNRFAVEDLVTPQLQAALGLFRWLELGVSLPVHVLYGARAPAFHDPAGNANQDDALHFAAQSIGDLGVHMKARLVDGWRHPLGLAALVSVYAPTGDAAHFLGEGQVTLRPELAVDTALAHRRLRLGLNVGALVRPSRHTFTDGGATLQGVPDVDGGAAFCQPAPAGRFPAPGDPTCGTQASRSVGTQLAYGVAVSYGVVRQRFDVVGELFGFADVTGAASAHPLEGLVAAKVYLATNSYFEVGGGAGLLPRTLDGGMTGSPGFRVFVGFTFEPTVGDRDGDGIKDDVDRCPDDPEDFDGFEDEDGCPDPDNDQDGLLDRDDQCPNVPGPVENHGCPLPPPPPPPPAPPPEPPTSIVKLHRGHLEVMRPIFFETDKAAIKPISYPTLDAVAATLRDNPQLLLVEIQGHADERGDDAYNLRLTEARAAAVKAYLVAHGVAAERLASHGYGETVPVCTQHTEACWAKNRRVEFVVKARSD